MSNDKKPDAAPAFDGDEKPGPKDSPVQIRPSGKENMADKPEDWDEVDEESDESFPASDPPTTY